jgi:hypothetical protein
VALGFGANVLVGVLASKRGLPIAEDASRKVKGRGMVALSELQCLEIQRVLTGARRECVFELGASASAPAPIAAEAREHEER